MCVARMFVPVPTGMHRHVASIAFSMWLASLAVSRAPVSMCGWELSVPLALHGFKLYGALRSPCRGVKMPNEEEGHELSILRKTQDFNNL